MLNLFFIKTFVSAAKIGSFRIAAERNFITQPAVSQHIRALEKTMGCALFERRGKKLFLTSAGKVFLPCAENILKQVEEAKMLVGEAMHHFNGTIRIASIYSIGLYELQPTVRKFLKKYPQIDIHIEYFHNNVIYEMVSNRTVDFGLVAFPRKAHGVIAKVFDEDWLVLVQSPHHRTIKKRKVTLSELNQINFIGFSHGTPTGKAIAQFLDARGVHPKIVCDYDNIETLKSAVIMGRGCAIVPKNTIVQELKDRHLEIIPLKEMDLKRPLGILHPAGKMFTKTTGTFYEMMLKK